MDRAREIYTKVIRSTLAYGASAFYTPSENPTGITAKLLIEQTKSLRTILGAYKATPVRLLETEAAVPPLDLYFRKRVEDFEIRLAQLPVFQFIQKASKKVRDSLRKRRLKHRYIPLPPQLPQEFLPTIPQSIPMPITPETPEISKTFSARRLLDRWKARWDESIRKRPPASPTAAGSSSKLPKFPSIHLYRGLRKAESSLLCQLRTEKVGLRAFLSRRMVPGFEDPNCQYCFFSEETVYHVICECALLATARATLSAAIGEEVAFWSERRLREALSTPIASRLILRWFLRTDRLPEYRLAITLLDGPGDTGD